MQLRLDSTPDEDKGDDRYSRFELTQLWSCAYGLARSLGLSCPDAEDLAQEVLLKLWLHRRSVEKPRAWLRTVVRHAADTRIRNGPLEVGLKDAPEPQADPRVKILSYLLAKELLEDLPKRQRLSLVLSVLGFSHVEIAARLGTTSKGVERLVARARLALRRRSASRSR